ncbi:similar to class III aminotransferase [Plenodomus lingam JN3]|uniref:Similar to class III aminotransferase n=1 Tax=Leptosphaeria maculans (strain JN3 / isolate v23.1.3 / race Av1-4-5-6-7-8) TaxID=985895 RepID=E5A7T5_LEPMJ|nr:similar to class III aminotransferase [Plenodomus lingam JN3]CBX99680.1 similar to class III aminotransferase [Plenodomus lingam JN3]
MAPGMICNESDISTPISDIDSDLYSITTDISRLSSTGNRLPRKKYLLHSKIWSQPRLLTAGKGRWWTATDDSGTWRVFDGSGGAAVSCIGYHDQRVFDAMNEQMSTGVSYAPAADFYTDPAYDLAEWVIKSTGHLMGGSDATEAALKMAIQYQTAAKPDPEPSRQFFIARHRSYHGATLASLEISGHDARKQPFRPNFSGKTSFISPCYPYRELMENETEDQYVGRLAEELETEIQRLGPKNVAAFVMEPVVGAALGCVAALPNYLAAMKAVCKRYGVLLIFDEVMCGMGRAGHLHAWQEEMVVPDIQIIGKGLAGGYAELSAILCSPDIHAAFGEGRTGFNHGHTFQNPPVGCAAALTVQRIIEEEDLVEKVRKNGEVLHRKLGERLSYHSNVGDIRGKGHFWGIELVSNKATKAPLPSEKGVAMAIHERGLTREHGIYIYPGSGTMDGKSGDHLIIAPAFNITDDEIDLLVERLGRLVEDYFNDYHRSTKSVL